MNSFLQSCKGEGAWQNIGMAEIGVTRMIGMTEMAVNPLELTNNISVQQWHSTESKKSKSIFSGQPLESKTHGPFRVQSMVPLQEA